MSGIHLIGAGVGLSYDVVGPNFMGATNLEWIGAPGATMLDVEPASTQSLYSDDVTGITFDCETLANICAKFEQVSNSIINVGAREPRSIGVWFTTEPSGWTDPPGNQQNDIWAWSWASETASYSPTGILFDQGAGSSFNTSDNRIHTVFAFYGNGDGIVFGGTDNNLIEGVDAQHQVGGTGKHVVFANSAYTMPNEIAVNGGSGYSRITAPDSSVYVAGYQSGATIVPGADTGSATVATITTTEAGSSLPVGSQTLTVTSATGIVPGLVVEDAANLGKSPLPQNDPVIAVTGSSVILANGTASGTLNTGITLAFTWGVTGWAVPGTYTMTAVDATHWNIAAPSGGHSQTGVAVANGAISFQDIVVPLSGMPATGDTFTVTVPHPATQIHIEEVSNNNVRGLPSVEAGATGFFTTHANAYPIPFGAFPLGVVGLSGANSGPQNNFAAVEPPSICQGAFVNSMVMTPQACSMTLRGTPSASSQLLTADTGINGVANCINLPPNTGYALQAVLTAFDQTNTAKSYSATWGFGTAPHLLTQGLTPSTTLIDGVSTAISPDVSRANGTLTGIGASLTADTINGCVTSVFTPPTGNTDTWATSMRVFVVKAP